MTSADSSSSIPSPHDDGSQWQTTRSPRVMRIHLHTYACRIYIHELPDRYSTLELLASSSVMNASYAICHCASLHCRTCVRPLPSAVCSSGQCFACIFLPTQSHDYAVDVKLTVPPVGPVRDFHPQVDAPCRAHQKKSPRQRGLCIQPDGR